MKKISVMATDFDSDAITESVEDICVIEEDDSTYITWHDMAWDGLTLRQKHSKDYIK